jgi:hypothetical protein
VAPDSQEIQVARARSHKLQGVGEYVVNDWFMPVSYKQPLKLVIQALTPALRDKVGYNQLSFFCS